MDSYFHHRYILFQLYLLYKYTPYLKWYYLICYLITKYRFIFNNQIVIICNDYLKTTYLQIKKILELNNFQVIVKEHLTNKDIDNNYLYLILHHNQKNIIIPKYFILWQIEQVDNNNSPIKKWNNFHFELLNKSLFIWEMSHKNLNFYQSKMNHPNKIIVYPLPFYDIYQHPYNINNKKYDLCFIGSINEKRKKILFQLRCKYKIIILTNMFEDKRDNYIKQSKFIINIHYYQDCSLEQDRINLGLLNNVPTISEDVIHDNGNKEIYKNVVTFFNLNNMDIVIKNNMDIVIKQCIRNYSQLMSNFIEHKNKIQQYYLDNFPLSNFKV